VVADLQPFYRENNRWIKNFLPAFINEYGNSPDPWDMPSRDALTLLQDVRDQIYPDTDQVVDEAGPVWYLVSFVSPCPVMVLTGYLGPSKSLSMALSDGESGCRCREARAAGIRNSQQDQGARRLPIRRRYSLALGKYVEQAYC
jgi:hypothetical protein